MASAGSSPFFLARELLLEVLFDCSNVPVMALPVAGLKSLNRGRSDKLQNMLVSWWSMGGVAGALSPSIFDHFVSFFLFVSVMRLYKAIE